MPLAAEAQKPAKVARVGVLLFSTPQADPQLGSFRQGLADLGYVEGQNITLEYRFAEGQRDRLAGLAAELVRLRVDVVVGIGGDVAPFAKKASETIPLVFASSADPVKVGLVASLARPGGNATGVTFILDELAAKRLQLLKEVAPGISRVAILWNPDHPDPDYHEVQRAARLLGVDLYSLEARGPDDLDRALQAAAGARVDALFVVSSRLTVLHHRKIVDFAMKSRLPLAGGSAGRGPSVVRSGRQRHGPPRSDLRRQNPQGRETGRPPRRAADEVRAGDQPQDRQGARPHDPTVHLHPSSARTR